MEHAWDAPDKQAMGALAAALAPHLRDGDAVQIGRASCRERVYEAV